MKELTRKFIISPKTTFIVLCAAIICFNNWFLGLIFNRPLFLRGASVSELSATGQPHEMVFRSLDVISGVLFIMAALLLLRHMNGVNSRLRYVLVFITVTFGISNAMDALMPMPCSETANTACNSPVSISLSHFSIPSHGYSSVAIAICYLALPLVGFFFALRNNHKAFSFTSLLTMTIAILSLAAFLVQYVFTHSFSARALGPSQELQMSALGLWFIAWFVAIRSLAKQRGLLQVVD